MSQTAFQEDFRSQQNDPLDDQSYDFDWPMLYERLGEAEDIAGDEEARERLALALKTVLQFIVEGCDLARPNAPDVICRRCIALLWTVSPAYFSDSPSLTTLAKKLGITKAALSHYAAGSRREFGVRNRAQAHGSNFKKEKAA